MNADACMTADELLERRIEAARIRMVYADSEEAKREAMDSMYELINSRSRRRIAEMEARLPEPWRS